ncbi:MAG: hypothetical protein M1832_000477 [Thelocarpon impressellum]|nr:MAG: hypothetical protein M1832_000477 [Thelocarpon impressellum]
MYAYIITSAFVLWLVLSNYLSWRRNLALAKSSGLTVISAPFYMGSMTWLILSLFVVPIARKLPNSWTEAWIDTIEPNWPFQSRFAPFARYGGMFFVASPGGIYMAAADAEGISQMCARRNDFQKPLEVYEIINIFGKTLISTEGSTWREHRKVIAPAFSEENHALVWKESLLQAQGMVDSWGVKGGNSADDMTVHNMQPEASSLSLHVISRAGFGIPLFWPGQSSDVSNKGGLAHFSSAEAPKAHNMPFKAAIDVVPNNIIWLAALSPSVLKNLPFRKPRQVYDAFVDCGLYFRELLEQKKLDASSGLAAGDSEELMASFVRGGAVEKIAVQDGKTGEEVLRQRLTDDEMIGNIFLMIFAGYETTANTIHHAMICLAINRAAQKQLQKDLDELLGGRAARDTDYTRDFDRLHGSMVGAVIHETLRLLSPVMLIPKCVRSTQQHLHINGRDVVIPNGTFIHINVIGTHRNPNSWPHSRSRRTGHPNDLDDFVPERWLLDHPYHTGRSHQGAADNEGDRGGVEFKDTSRLFSPPRGAFVPFSDGHRSCPGRRFALAEVTAVLATIFQRYTVELAVDEWASDAEVAQMTNGEKAALHAKAVDKAYWQVDTGLEAILTMKFKPGRQIPVRFVRRGKERFCAG